MAINYERVGWDTSNFVNPTNMNQMDKGIKDACDGVDGLKERIGVADISEIGDGTVKGAIKDVAENRNLRTYTQIADLGLSISATLKDIIKAMPKGSTIIIDPWNPLSDFPIMQSGYWVVRITRGYSGIGYVDIYATLHNADGSIARHWIGHYLESNDTIAWVEYLPLTGGTLTGSILLSDAVGAYPNVMLGYSSDGEGAKIQYDKGNKNAAFTVSTDGRIVDFFIFPKADLKSVLGLHCDDQWFDVFGSHNKHAGSYTGNGSATERTIDTGGYGGILTIRSTQGIAFVTVFGTFCITNSGTVKYITNTSWDGYKVTISTDDALLNGSGVTYAWYVL